jgi:hypothetical protein
VTVCNIIEPFSHDQRISETGRYVSSDNVRELVLTNILSLLATQNEKAVKNLKLGMLIPTVLHLLLRLLLRRKSLPPSKGSLAIYIITFIPTFFLARYLQKIGTTRRDDTGKLVSPGEDLNQPGITEWCFDIIYVTCKVFSGVYLIHLLKLLMYRGMPDWKWSLWGMGLVSLASCKAYCCFSLTSLSC